VRRFLRLLRIAAWRELVLGLLVFVLGARMIMLHRQLADQRSDLSSLRAIRSALDSEASRMTHDQRYLWSLLGASRLAEDLELRGYDEGGASLTWHLSALAAPHLFFTLDQTCPSCASSLPVLQALAAAAPCGLGIVAISLNDQPPPTWTRATLGFDVVRMATGSAWRHLPLATPAAAILVLPGGKVGRWWIGTMTEAEATEVRHAAAVACRSG